MTNHPEFDAAEEEHFSLYFLQLYRSHLRVCIVLTALTCCFTRLKENALFKVDRKRVRCVPIPDYLVESNQVSLYVSHHDPASCVLLLIGNSKLDQGISD